MSSTRRCAARKAHRCHSCNGAINPGDVYLQHTALRGDEFGYSEYGDGKRPQRSNECGKCATRYGRGDYLTVELNPNGTIPNLCDVCGVDHRWSMANLSHGIIYLIQHAQERLTWMEYPINGDMVARQRAGILNNSLLFSTTDPEEIDWAAVEAGKAR